MSRTYICIHVILGQNTRWYLLLSEKVSPNSLFRDNWDRQILYDIISLVSLIFKKRTFTFCKKKICRRSDNKGTGVVIIHYLCSLEVTDMYCYMGKRNNSRASVVVFHPLIGVWQANEMAGVIENYFKFEVRTVIKFLQAEGVSQSEIHQ